MNAAFQKLISKIGHVYLDDIIIWSQTLEEHKKNVEVVMLALQNANLLCSIKKMELFCTEIDFLGHHISARGIEPNAAKIQRIMDWKSPRSAKEVRSFLGLVRYIATFLPKLAEHTRVLTPLTAKGCNAAFPKWTVEHELAFRAIKDLVLSADCLTTIDHTNPGKNRIFVTCDSSDWRTGAVLSFGETWETARPVAFDSQQLNSAQLNYPVHEKELLAIIRALTKWRVDLLGSEILIYTDHRTLEAFNGQRNLSRRQCRWQEFLAQYDYKIIYIKGEDNTVADVLSCLPNDPTFDHELPSGIDDVLLAAVFSISGDASLLADIKNGYNEDPFCEKLIKNTTSVPGFHVEDGLYYVGSCLVIPRYGNLQEQLFRLAHDSMGHFGFEKLYGSLRESYYWPNMRKDLENAYVPSCDDCQCNKGRTHKPAGPLHPLPIPDARFDSVAIDFIGPLPPNEGFDSIITMTDHLGADIRIVPSHNDLTAEKFAVIFFDHWYCENSLPADIVSDRDKLFISKFWKALTKLTGVKLKMSSLYHPETDGASERSNKTVNQALRFHVERNQRGWVRALPRVRFDMLNTINASTGFTGFQLKTGHSPRVIPLLVPLVNTEDSSDIDCALRVLKQLDDDVREAKDNLLEAKVSQATHLNRHCGKEVTYMEKDHVMLSTLHWRREYLQKDNKRVAKFMLRYDGPYTVEKAFPERSVYTLDMPNSPNLYPTFHAALLLKYMPKNPSSFPGRVRKHLGTIIMEDGEVEWWVESILDERKRGRGYQYLVRWVGEGPENDLWLPRRELEDCEALDVWLASKNHV